PQYCFLEDRRFDTIRALKGSVLRSCCTRIGNILGFCESVGSLIIKITIQDRKFYFFFFTSHNFHLPSQHFAIHRSMMAVAVTVLVRITHHILPVFLARSHLEICIEQTITSSQSSCVKATLPS